MEPSDEDRLLPAAHRRGKMINQSSKLLRGSYRPFITRWRCSKGPSPVAHVQRKFYTQTNLNRVFQRSQQTSGNSVRFTRFSSSAGAEPAAAEATSTGKKTAGVIVFGGIVCATAGLGSWQIKRYFWKKTWLRKGVKLWLVSRSQ